MIKEKVKTNEKYVRNSLLTSLIMTASMLILYGLVCIWTPLALIVMLVPNVVISIIKSIVFLLNMDLIKRLYGQKLDHYLLL